MGGGGGGYFPSRPKTLHDLIQGARESVEQQRLNSEINKLMQDILTTLNERDTDRIKGCLEKIRGILSERVEMEQFLFGGSVAKHTYVDGLSDVDALAILSETELADKSPRTILNVFHKLLKDKLTADEIKSVDKGKLAVTVTYQDKTEIQLLPALRIGSKVLISDAWGNKWKETNPKIFQRALTRANERLNCSLVPAIKLAKSIISGFPKQKRITGYHIEALSLEAMKGYRGIKTVQALLKQIFSYSSNRVKRPINDVTGQSRVVDSYLGKSNSIERRIVADAIAGVSRKLNTANSVDQWKTILED